MPKTFRFQFDKGVNVVADKATTEPGYVTVADNVDLRAGLPRPYRAPVKYSSAPGGTVRIFEYRGKFYTSSTMRDYAAEFVNGHDRIYYTEYGDSPFAETRIQSEGACRKIIDGFDVTLGTKAPNVAPVITATKSLTPVVTVTEGTDSGPYKKDSTRSYRVSAITANGVQIPSSSQTITFTANGKSAKIQWTAVPGATGYWIFAGDTNKEAKIAEVSSITRELSDSGQYPATGDSAVNYDVNTRYTYVYTFERTVGGMTNESGPSPVSAEFSASIGRQINFDILNDGFFTQDDAQSVPSDEVTVVKSSDYTTVLAVDKVMFDDKLKRIGITCTTKHDLNNGDFVFISGATDSSWNGKTFEVTVDASGANAGTFYIKDVPKPTDTSYSAWVITPAKTKIVFANAPSKPIESGDVVYVKLEGSSQHIVGSTFKALALSSTEFVINAYTDNTPSVGDSVKWVPKNGYIKYRNLYRTGDAGGFFLVEQVPIWKSSFTDDKTFSNLGDAITSVYTENGIQVVYSHPPIGMSQITLHYEMLFAIDQHKVRWTPVGVRDAWPEDFSIEFPSKPVALASFSGGLIVLCLDAIYRIDGNVATMLSRSKTLAENGCIAPYSVQKTHAGLVYLSDRGVMLFDGMRAECITDRKIPGEFLIGPSSLVSPVYHWWHPTLLGYNYSNLSAQDGILYKVTNAFSLTNTNAPGGVVRQIRSFYYKGKYFLFWAAQKDNDYYRAHTTFCIDLQVSGFPITTLGLKPIDAHVSDLEQAYILVGSPDITVDAALAAFRMQFVYAGFGSHFIAQWMSSKFTGGGGTPGAGGFTLTVTPASKIGYPGTSTTYAVAITRNNFTGIINLSLLGLPSGVTGSVSPSTTTGNSATISLNIPSSMSMGKYLMTLQGTSGTITQTASFELEIAQGNDFSLSLSPTSSTVVQGNTATFQVLISRSAGFTSTVALTADGLPTGVTASISPASTDGNSSTVTLSVGASVTPATYPISIKGVGGGLTRTASYVLNVSKAGGGNDGGGGKFDLTNALIYWDCKLETSGLVSMPNKVAGATQYNGTRMSAYAFNTTLFTPSTPYKISSGSADKFTSSSYFCGTTKDFYRYTKETKGDIIFYKTSPQRVMIKVPAEEGLDSLTNVTSYDALPVKSFCGIFWQETYSASDVVDLFTYYFKKTGNAMVNSISVRREGTKLAVITDNLTKAEYDISSIWGFDKGIVFVGAAFNLNSSGVGTITLFVNRAAIPLSVTLGSGSLSERDYPRNFAIGTTITDPGAGYDPPNPTNKFACLDFVAYSDVKDIGFMAKNASVWGL